MDGISASMSGVNVAAQSIALSSNNVANLNTDGYKAKSLQQQALPQGGVEASAVRESQQPTSPGGSNVDLATEAAIVAATEALMRGRTTFVITHRPGMLRHCDVQYELRDGALVVEGYFDVLQLQQQGINQVVAPLGTALMSMIILPDGSWTGRSTPIAAAMGSSMSITS